MARNLTGEQQKKLELLRLQQEYQNRLRLAFDSRDVTSAPTPHQMAILQSSKNIHYVIGSNRSGKSQLGSRVISWWFENNHPYLDRPAKWGQGPIQILLVGRVGEQMDSELWDNKVRPFLTPGSYKVVRQGNSISRIEHTSNGNKIIFISHHDADQARQKAQAYTAQVVWLDEMPTKVGILNELRARVFDSDGFMYCTFTPLLKNAEIKKIVDTPSERGQKWFISALDNPKFSDMDRGALIAEFRAMSSSESEFNARLYGQWISGEHTVFHYDSERNWMNPPEYDPAVWPHVAMVDPAASGKVGVTVWARRPQENIWHCVLAKYLNGDAFSSLVPEVETLISTFNILGRICDCNPSGFYKEAHKQGIKYQPVTDKAFNKENSIEDCNKAMATQQVFFGPGSEVLIDELISCARNEENPNLIIKASKYHTADTFRYFVARREQFKAIAGDTTPANERIRKAWKQRLQKEQQRVTVHMRKTARDMLINQFWGR